MSFMDFLQNVNKSSSSASNNSSSLQQSQQPARKHPLLEKITRVRESASTAATFHCTTNERISDRKNLGILVIIVDEFPNEPIWRLWLAEHGSHGDDSQSDIEIWFHAKYPDRVKSAWVRERLVKSFHYSPQWGSVELTKVMVCLLKEAMTVSPHLNKFMFASESCIPLLLVRAMLDAMYCSQSSSSSRSKPLETADIDYTSSWVNYTDRPNNGYAAQKQFGLLTNVFPPNCSFKADQWIMLSRTHGLELLSFFDALQKEADVMTGTSSSIERRTSHQNSGSATGTAGSSGEDVLSSTIHHPAYSIFGPFKAMSASDEIFFPSCLALIKRIGKDSGDGGGDSGGSSDSGSSGSGGGGSSGSGESSKHTSGDGGSSTDSTTAAHAAAADRILKPVPRIKALVHIRRVTFADWSDNGRNPQTYYVTAQQKQMPLILLAMQVGSKGSVPSMSLDSNVVLPLTTMKRAIRDGSVFFRKIKLPSAADYFIGGQPGSNSNHININIEELSQSENNGSNDAVWVAVSEAALSFVQQWTKFVFNKSLEAEAVPSVPSTALPTSLTEDGTITTASTNATATTTATEEEEEEKNLSAVVPSNRTTTQEVTVSSPHTSPQTAAVASNSSNSSLMSKHESDSAISINMAERFIADMRREYKNWLLLLAAQEEEIASRRSAYRPQQQQQQQRSSSSSSYQHRENGNNMYYSNNNNNHQHQLRQDHYVQRSHHGRREDIRHEKSDNRNQHYQQQQQQHHDDEISGADRKRYKTDHRYKN